MKQIVADVGGTYYRGEVIMVMSETWCELRQQELYS